MAQKVPSGPLNEVNMILILEIRKAFLNERLIPTGTGKRLDLLEMKQILRKRKSPENGLGNGFLMAA
ncbi:MULTISPECIES: hypothetical protein [unclassified Rhizobium]|uniref:hypothetical protein n=1 Tax=unclassified Rhizobium TaxID=2613769 RepID=UPI001AE2BD67|nr:MULTISPECIES: hypothetical protein [unclassified Rhizobium]MBP2462141.1 hypothetical protein [Rhizobium sp. PvP014]MBP2529537.1 hypothetical protein [Rhizobium sp. PvP099]